MQYIKIILPLKLAWEPCYRISEEVLRGMRVNVTFSGRKYTGVVSETGVVPEVDVSRILPVNSVERHMEIIGEKELALWHFIADYYLCTIGEVYKLAYPAAKTAGEEVRARAEERRELMKARTEELYRKRIVALEERLAKKEAALSGRHNAKVTAELEAGRDKIVEELRVVREKLAALEEVSGELSVVPTTSVKAPLIEETPAYSEVQAAFAEGRTVLLLGGAARTDLLVQAAGEALAAGRDVLMLVPEISLTKRLQAILRESFGDSLLVFHSAKSQGSRHHPPPQRPAEAGTRHPVRPVPSFQESRPCHSRGRARYRLQAGRHPALRSARHRRDAGKHTRSARAARLPHPFAGIPSQLPDRQIRTGTSAARRRRHGDSRHHGRST